MRTQILASPSSHNVSWLGLLLPLWAGLYCGHAAAACPTAAPFAAYQDIDLSCKPTPPGATYASTGPTAINDQVALCPTPPASTTSVTWALGAGVGCSGPSQTTVTCGGMTIAAPVGPAPVTTPVTLTGATPPGVAIFTATATDANNNLVNCSRDYVFRITAAGGGWGDPHMTTVDGVHYDFQSAGEFTALRGDGVEIQTRQTPVATTFLPGANAYTGLATCVSLYSAVAARVGAHRVSYEPNISGVPDPSGLQLRVDGVLTTLTSDGIELTPRAGRIVKSPVADGGIEIHYANGTQLVVTPAWWQDQQKWYLNITASGTTATEGIYGKLAKDGWLPALPNGTSLGPKPDASHQRYVQLYQTFADAWRVTDATSLFDYLTGTSTASFTRGEWPRENPQSCAIPQQVSATPVSVAVATQACGAISDKNMNDDCVFDVSVTGHTGFAKTYGLTQQLQPGATDTTVKGDKDPSKLGDAVTFTATVAPRVPRGGGAPIGTVQFTLDGGKVGAPIALDSDGHAPWTTSSLQVGQHQIAAQYIPAGWRAPFTASTSPTLSHTVLAAGGNYWWLIVLLLIVILVVWLLLRRA